MGKLEDLKKEIQTSGKSINDLGDIFTKFGITPDNPNTVKEMMKEAGLDENLTPDDAAKVVKNMTDMLPPEIKKQIASMVNEISKSIPAGPMPDDLKELLNSWQRGEDSEKVPDNG